MCVCARAREEGGKEATESSISVCVAPGIGGRHFARRYECQRVFATAPDHTKIPISIVYRRDLCVCLHAPNSYRRGHGQWGSHHCALCLRTLACMCWRVLGQRRFRQPTATLQ